MGETIDIREQLSYVWETNRKDAERMLELAEQQLGQLSLERSGQMQLTYEKELDGAA